jgi:hypothetical protein
MPYAVRSSGLPLMAVAGLLISPLSNYFQRLEHNGTEATAPQRLLFLRPLSVS